MNNGRFISALPDTGVRWTTTLDRQDNLSAWIVVPIMPWISVYSKLLQPDSDSFERIVCALTQSPVCHTETWIGDDAPSEIVSSAESRIGWPYDFEGMLGAWKDSGFHVQGKDFCSGLSFELLGTIPLVATGAPILPGLQPYPSPGCLLRQVTGMVGQPMPLLDSLPLKVSEDDLEWLLNLPADQLATGTKQEVIAILA